MDKNTDNSKLTPMMQQFYSVKKDFPDSILFFRMGDFYEMFEDDAVVASKVLGIALTSRNKSSDNSPPMCGIPYHSYQTYLNKLLNAGYKVAICEQLEDPSKTKGIVKRGVVRVVTPGTVIEDESLGNSNFNFLTAISKTDSLYYSVVADISTGDLFLFHSKSLNDVIDKFKPKEIIGEVENLKGEKIPFYKVDKTYHFKTMLSEILNYFNGSSLKSVGITEDDYVRPLFYLISYLKSMMIDVNLKRPVVFLTENQLYLDSVAQKTLELFESSSGRKDATLFGVLNRCSTPMGERLLSLYIMSPTNDIEEIATRQNLVEYFLLNKEIRLRLKDYLKEIYDLERIMTRIAAKKASPADLTWLKNSLKPLSDIKNTLEKSNNPFVEDIYNSFDDLKDVYDFLDTAVVDDPPATIEKGGAIKDGYVKEIDELRFLRKNSRAELAKIETEEKNLTGINTLKVKYNKVFGYYIEVPKSQSKNVPAYFERKQTLVNAERYVTAKLKELEEKILTAEDRLIELEKQAFGEIVEKILEHNIRIRFMSGLIARLDVILSFAETAQSNRYTKPVVNERDVIKIIDARHPVIEKFIDEPFVPNDIFLNNEDSRLMIITGPNMAGKSTYIRTVALVCIMAHIGSFVPAKSAEIGTIDRIFTRIGASDNISQGESTFMVEMVETGNILNNATGKSLVVLDEIGRGTSTFDGVSIAWAISEYLLNRVRAKTLFATHYHELSDIPIVNHGAKNLTIEVKEWKNEIIFLRKIIEGSSDRSYGIYVAKLAGLPDEVIVRSDEILRQLEKNEFGVDGLPKLAKTANVQQKQQKIIQPILIFEENEVLTELRKIDVNKITPLEALNILARLKELADE